MSPMPYLYALEKREVVPKPSNPDNLIIEAWAQGYMVGSLIIMAFITMANMRRGVLLHKLILGIWQGFWLFFPKPVYAWWLSVGAIFLNASWSLHNVISWLKIKPFLSKSVSWTFIGTVILVQPYWVAEIYANFAYFHGKNKIFERTRPWEALCRDPWWIVTTVALVWTIKTQYELTLREILRISPRFGIMLFSMVVSIIFIICDICSVTGAFQSSLPVGINPFWKLAFVFKCLTDMVVLDDFKTALDRLRAFKISRIGSFCQDPSDRSTWDTGNRNLVRVWEGDACDGPNDPLSGNGPLHSPDGALLNIRHNPFGSNRRLRKDDADTRTSTPEFIARDFGDIEEGPENLVPSNLYGPPVRPFQNAHFHEGSNGYDSGGSNRDSGHFPQGMDYARAMREVQHHDFEPADGRNKRAL
ncbi:hypothetical protein M011DRAFT_506412 [Sporormia fimetaria CBS 119925]|uniref:Uncharacterized protein n=1 Tax=Sporormia fimetaria CBS 119925 TaxID=1340428 RepID=A0A6A6V5S5_9PLEO|nr:hypothetical protein M011DRAFT_506412 [Sporormia fimetaria CBS 119925]